MKRTRTASKPDADQGKTGYEFYIASPWIKFRRMLWQRNPMCQRIEYGERCHRAAAIGHHLISPLDSPELAYVTSNVVMVCRGHHPDSRGTPWWKLGIDYVKTIGFGD